MDDIIKRCIFVIGRQRSGTTVFRRALASHPQVVDLGEVMHSKHKAGFYGLLADALANNPVKATHNHWFDLLTDTIRRAAAGTDPEAHLVVDMKYNMALTFGSTFVGGEPVNAFIARTAQRGGTVVQIIRRNKLALLASEHMAIKTGQWGINKADEERKDDKVRIILKTLGERLLNELGMDRHFEQQIALVTNRQTVVYEEMFDETGAFRPEPFDLLARQTGLSQAFDLTPRQIKLGRPLIEMLANYDDIANVVRNLVTGGALAPIFLEYLQS